tara:strand:- start:98 stop:394 length:297 start_codon:yes stop_codon:yes gene_type:complete
MKKFILILSIFFLLIFTTITKNSTKEIEKEIYNIREKLRILEKKYELVLLDFNYLSSPQKLIDYQSRYFENELSDIDITRINKLRVMDNKITIKKFTD